MQLKIISQAILILTICNNSYDFAYLQIQRESMEIGKESSQEIVSQKQEPILSGAIILR